MTLPLVSLHPISPENARRIVAREPLEGDAWHPEYPFDDELGPLRPYAAGAGGHPVFTFYQVRESATGLAVGGIGFFGPPDAVGPRTGIVELGFGLVAAARGRGLASAALAAALDIARGNGATSVIADTVPGNVASQRVLEKNGFVELRRDDELVYFRRDLELQS